MERTELFDRLRTLKPDRRYAPADVELVDQLADELGIPALSAGKVLQVPLAFYEAVRAITGALDQVQVDVIQAMLAEGSRWSMAWMAYGLATAWHEARLRPIEEIGKGKGMPYGVPGRNGGQIPYGRGLAQLTHDDNYEKADEELRLHGALIRDYAKALDPDIAVAILISGMTEGWFTGKGLGDYLPDQRGAPAQFVAARRIINGTDRAEMIAGYAQQFQAALTVGGWS